MIDEKIINKVKESQASNKTISKDLADKINAAWAKQKPWEKIPTPGNINKFMKKLNLTVSETKEVKKIFNLG